MSGMAMAEVWAEFAAAPGVAIEPGGRLEVALDCLVCRRTGRTMILGPTPGAAICAKTRHPVNGMIEERRCEIAGGIALVSYRIFYPTGAFIDARDGEPSVAHPTWARIAALVTCPACKTITECGTQNNAGRPWRRQCACGRPLLDETAENPRFRLLGPAGETLYEQLATAYEIWLDPAAPDTIIAALAGLLGADPAALRALTADGRPVFARRAYDNRSASDHESLARLLKAAALLLLRAGAGFDIRLGGRSRKAAYLPASAGD